MIVSVEIVVRVEAAVVGVEVSVIVEVTIVEVIGL